MPVTLLLLPVLALLPIGLLPVTQLLLAIVARWLVRGRAIALLLLPLLLLRPVLLLPLLLMDALLLLSLLPLAAIQVLPLPALLLLQHPLLLALLHPRLLNAGLMHLTATAAHATAATHAAAMTASAPLAILPCADVASGGISGSCSGERRYRECNRENCNTCQMRDRSHDRCPGKVPRSITHTFGIDRFDIRQAEPRTHKIFCI